MSQRWRRTLATALCAAGFSQPVLAQGVAPTILQVDVENFVRYVEDINDPSRFATIPGVTPASVPRNFGEFVAFADIVAVNGQPVKGTYSSRGRLINLSPAPTAGSAIADTTRTGAVDTRFEILNIDGTAVGTVVAVEVGGGPPPPGAPLAITQGNNAIVGGTGAYLGVRGSFGQAVTSQSVATRMASMAEDPGNRRKNGGGRTRFVLELIPMERPEILVTAGMPAIAHASSNEVVTVANPAAAGETLTAFATGLGPTVPGVDPGQPFPASRLSVVNSQVQVTVNGRSTDAILAVGVPGLVDTYAVTFRAPSETGNATVSVTEAWIAGPTATFPVK